MINPRRCAVLRSAAVTTQSRASQYPAMASNVDIENDPYKVTSPSGVDYSQYQSGPNTAGTVTHAGQREYQNSVMRKLNSRQAWAIHWAVVAFLCLLVWTIGASAPFRTGGIGFAMFCGILYMTIAIIQSVKYFLRPESFENKMDDLYDKIIPTSAPNQWIRVGWWGLWCLFWLASWGAVAGQNLCSVVAGFAGDQCSKTSATVAFSVFVWFHTVWKTAFCVMDATGTPR